MFNVSALLLDDTSKTATLLTNGVVNQTLRSLPHSVTIACFSWLTVVIVNIDRPSVEEHFEQHN